jgi:hypothetical protein
LLFEQAKELARPWLIEVASSTPGFNSAFCTTRPTGFPFTPPFQQHLM